MKELVTAYLQSINPWFVVSVILMLVVLVLFLSGCADPCHGNPRNMKCMSASEIERALAEEK